jgi:hypothetical protein
MHTPCCVPKAGLPSCISSLVDGQAMPPCAVSPSVTCVFLGPWLPLPASLHLHYHGCTGVTCLLHVGGSICHGPSLHTMFHHCLMLAFPRHVGLIQHFPGDVLDAAYAVSVDTEVVVVRMGCQLYVQRHQLHIVGVGCLTLPHVPHGLIRV